MFSTAVIRNVRLNYPQSFIACVIPPRCSDVLKGNPNLDEIIVFDEKGRHKSPFAKLNFIRMLAGRKFDEVFFLHRSLSRALICRLSGIPQRTGHYTKKRAFLLTRNIMPPDRDSLHRIDYYLNVIEKAGLKIYDRHTEFFFEEKDKEFVRDFLNRNSVTGRDFVVGINPGGNWLPKRWPIDYWAGLIDKLSGELGAKVIVTGAGSDGDLIKQLQACAKEKFISAAGALDLKQLGALCGRLDLFITADSGPLHIAKASGAKKIIALFGPTDPAITGPYPQDGVVILRKDTGCRIPCYNVDCKDNRCMKAILPQEVIDEVKLSGTNRLIS